MCDPDQPTSSKLLDDDDDDGDELLADDTSFLENYDGIEELCDYDPEGSPEPGEIIELPEEGVMVCGVEEVDEESLCEIEEGEYIAPAENPLLAVNSSQTAAAQVNSGSKIYCLNDGIFEGVNAGKLADDGISLTESPLRGPLDIALFEENLLESPTESEYFGKDRSVTAPSFPLPAADTK
ncbi:unnamed protein product [Strongylus vulgaris]|uniref:Uncharacterized protein n=1 Tax=Strongylus vulgaris TaxID=40348 RepID=A0A3P7KEM1_STRVU|nr:unnamed protein product [Strongylus vulgaris]